MMHIVLGAPGSGKSTVISQTAEALPDRIILDWDALMASANVLAGIDIPRTKSAWPAYAILVRTMVEAVGPHRVVLFGVQTPDEMAGWPVADWILLDCADDERRRRLARRGEAEAGIVEAIEDAKAYRQLDLFTIDGTRLTPFQIAQCIAARVSGQP